MGDVSTYGKNIRNLLGSMKHPGSNLCADTRRYKYSCGQITLDPVILEAGRKFSFEIKKKA